MPRKPKVCKEPWEKNNLLSQIDFAVCKKSIEKPVVKMKIKIINRKKNPSLHREEIVFQVKESKSTPARKEIKEKIAALQGAKPETVIIHNIKTEFGTNSSEGKAFVYEDEKILAKTELRYMVDKNLGIKREKKAKGKKTEKKK